MIKEIHGIINGKGTEKDSGMERVANVILEKLIWFFYTDAYQISTNKKKEHKPKLNNFGEVRRDDKWIATINKRQFAKIAGYKEALPFENMGIYVSYDGGSDIAEWQPETHRIVFSYETCGKYIQNDEHEKIKSVVMHELTHAVNCGKRTDSNPKAPLYMDEKDETTAYLKEFLYLFNATEMNARVNGMYYHLRGVGCNRVLSHMLRNGIPPERLISTIVSCENPYTREKQMRMILDRIKNENCKGVSPNDDYNMIVAILKSARPSVGISTDANTGEETKEKFGSNRISGLKIPSVQSVFGNYSKVDSETYDNRLFNALRQGGVKAMEKHIHSDNKYDYNDYGKGNVTQEYVDRKMEDIRTMLYNRYSKIYEKFHKRLINAAYYLFSPYIERYKELYASQNTSVKTVKESVGITMDDVTYMVNESIKKISEVYNPRESVPKVRGGWTEAKILKYLKHYGSLKGMKAAIKLIAEFDNVEELKSHIFYHGSKHIQGCLKPSISFPKNWGENEGGGGYGDRYWGISLSKSKRTASNFGGANSRGVNVHPIVLAKNANVIVGEGWTDASDADERIVDLYTQGVDAVWVGEGGGGEGELLVINPRCICNMDAVQHFEYYNMNDKYKDKLNNASDEQLQELLDSSKEWVNNKYREPLKPSRPLRSKYFDVEKGLWRKPEKPQRHQFYFKDNPDDAYQQAMIDYQKKLDMYNQAQRDFEVANADYEEKMKAYYDSNEYKQYQDRRDKMHQRMSNLEENGLNTN